jgi:predicted Zn-dependent protease with MMP-like domain
MNFDALSLIAEEETRIVLESLPPEMRSEVEALPVFFEPLPNEEDKATGIAEDTLGFYDTVPVPRIRLWLENIWDFSEEDEEIFREEVQTTLLHEIGHHLGWDEDEIADRGLG